MNKKRNIYWFAALVLFASCSNNEEEHLPFEISLKNSDVEIRLSTDGGGATRSSIESTPTGLFETENIGVFCLAIDNLGVNPQELDINWFTYNGEETYSVWMNNVESVAKINEDSTATNISWADGISRWYPTGNWHRYCFYGYYPRQATTVSTATSVQVNIPIDGTQDIIYGKTDIANSDLAYCAKYFRDSRYQNVTPKLGFEHKLMRLTFTYEAGLDANGSTLPALQMGVVSVKVKDVPSVATLVVADKEKVENEGEIYYDWNNNLVDYILLDDGDKPLSEDYWVQETPVNIGQGILVPVPEDPDKRYYIEVVLKDKSGNIFNPEHPMELRSVTGGFKSGKSYNVNMTIHGPKVIELQGTLSPWEKDETVIDGVTY